MAEYLHLTLKKNAACLKKKTSRLLVSVDFQKVTSKNESFLSMKHFLGNLRYKYILSCTAILYSIYYIKIPENSYLRWSVK